MRKKLLQNTLFAAIAAWALSGIQAHMDASFTSADPATMMVALR